ncbi:calcium/proton exchanger [Chamaesiphon sp. OTE_75_metabat_556]|uniref:calcium/proton exchanger n=1 Tax=Chamaesiphon sp. OTE_75_metabat_556 TaxID=2964692 RepID=UPI00286B888E|nr:calcium/proton exchanger [Chamaesiphon sp. OTE_75_metabat_556]
MNIAKSGLFAGAIATAILVFIPLSCVAKYQHWGDLSVFATSALAIILLSIVLSTATEKIAMVTGPSIGGLVNAVFGNATELILALMALRAGLVDIVKSSITGSILGALLLLLGLGMLTGGLRYKEQSFKPIFARVNGSLMTLGVTAIALPTLVIYTSNLVDHQDIHRIGMVTASVLIVLYGLTLLFSLKTHSYLYDVAIAESDSGSVVEPAANNEIVVLADRNIRLGGWIAVLLIASVAVGLESNLFVEVVETSTGQLGFTPLFTGVILLPLLSDVAGYVTIVRLALKDRMDLAVSTVTGDSLLITLFIAPVLVFVGQLWGQPLDLNFNPFEVVALAIAVTVNNLVSSGGRSNWLDGTLLLATYFLLGVAFYYHPA